MQRVRGLGECAGGASGAVVTAGARVPDAHETSCRAYLRGGECALVRGSGELELARAGDRIVGPPVFVRKGFRMVTSPALFFPSSVLSDYGAAIGADDAAGWIARSGMGHPRAEAQGVLADGSGASCLLRDLDLSEPCLLFAAVKAGDFPGMLVVADLREAGASAHPLGEIQNAGSLVQAEDQFRVMDNVDQIFAGRRNA